MFWLRCCLLAGFHNFFLQKNQSGNNDDKLYVLPSVGIKTKFPDHSDLFGILSKFWLFNGTLPSESRNLLKQKIGKNSWNLMFAVGFTYCFRPEYRNLLYLRSTMTHEVGRGSWMNDEISVFHDVMGLLLGPTHPKDLKLILFLDYVIIHSRIVHLILI